MFRVGVVGFGRIAESAHVPAWLSLPGVEVVAIADLNDERRQAAHEAVPGARIYENCQAMLEDQALDCLDICTPPHDHLPSILAGCAHRVARIVCEKPLTAAVEEYRMIVTAQQQSGCQVYTINSWVQSELHRKVTSMIATGSIGSVRHVSLRTLRPDCALGVSDWQPRWRTDPTYAGGGIVLDHGWHQLYLMARWIGASPEGVQAQLRTVQKRHAPVEDEAIIDLQFPQATGRIELSWAAPERANDGEIVGTLGSIVIGDDGLTVRTATGTRVEKYGERLSDSSYHPAWFRELFARVIADDEHSEGQDNLHEAEMLLTTLFAAYPQRKPAFPERAANIA